MFLIKSSLQQRLADNEVCKSPQFTEGKLIHSPLYAEAQSTHLPYFFCLIGKSWFQGFFRESNPIYLVLLGVLIIIHSTDI